MIELCFDTPCGGRTCYQRELAVPRSLHGISASAFSLSPNPASDNVIISLAEDTKAQNNRTIKTAFSSDDSYEIQLWNSFGLVKQVTTAQPKYQLSLLGIPAGFYYVHVIKDKMTYRKQLIVK
ncbi:MAG: T9SS type A sorting domain-containing protein [Pigmentiphaga sp.]|nr:T9SS type A sorting domain-containing protein [Pigmentiphaga sp.]